MESANFHQQQQHQDNQPVLDSSCYGLSWSQNPILNDSNNDTNSRDLKQHIDNNINFVPCDNTSINPTLGLPWNTNNNRNHVTSNIIPIENFMTHEFHHLARIKHEFSTSESYPKFSEMINMSSPTSSIEDLHLNNPSPGYNNNNQDLLLTSFSNGCQIENGQIIDQSSQDDSQNNGYQNSSTRTTSRGTTFSQILPTINISNLNSQSRGAAFSSNSFDMNLPALDLFGSPRFNGNISHPSNSFIPQQIGSFFKDTCLSYGLDQMHQRSERPVICRSKISSAFNSRTNSTEAKRPATSYMDTKAPQATVPKKSKLEPRTSCAPLKVRKEKLGDRIAALQQLVAPLGKTDTASVLMEAYGYIKFLQNQVETLSVPYMKSTHKNSRLPARGLCIEDGNEDAKRDLRTRGLCLVPLSCLSYVTDHGAGCIWPAP